MDELLKHVWLTVWLTICAGTGAYFGSYLKKKAENLATHEDVEKVVQEVRAVTRATEEIKANISGDLWDRQKQWELKRDAVFEATKLAASLQDSLTAMQSFYDTQKALPGGTPERADKRTQLYGDFNKAATEYDQAVMLLALVCAKEVIQESMYLSLLARTLAEKMNTGQPDAFSKSTNLWAARLESMRAAMRKELGLPALAVTPPPRPQNHE